MNKESNFRSSARGSKPQWRRNSGDSNRARSDARHGSFAGNRRNHDSEGDGRRGGFRGNRRDSQRKGGFAREQRHQHKPAGFEREVRNRHGFGPQDSRYVGKEWRHENEPSIPEGVKAKDLDKYSLMELRSLDKNNAEKVAQHLVMAGSLIDIDPEGAYQHAYAAVTRAGRIGVVREAAALAAYACGKYSEALREVRAARRLTGSESLKAVEADCERGLGRPEKAIQIAENTDIKDFDLAEVAELILVEAGARSDLKQYDAALLLINHFLQANEIEEPVTLARLLSCKVDILTQMGRTEEAAVVSEEIPAIQDQVTIMDLEEIVEADNSYQRSDLCGSRKPLNEIFDGILLDLDGVCYQGENVIDHVVQTLGQAHEIGWKYGFITNNASRTPEQVVAKLAGMGIKAEAGSVMTSALDAAAILKQKLPPAAKVLAIGGEGLIAAVRDAGFELVDTAAAKPAAVVQGYSPEITYAQLMQASYAINEGAAFIATNLDKTIPTEEGFAPGNGSLISVVVEATGKTPYAGGKPFPNIYRVAKTQNGMKNPVFVGDRLDTDIAGARAAGLKSLHVLTGVNDAVGIALAKVEERPSYLGLDLRDLLLPHPGPVRQPTGLWHCGDSSGFKVERGGVCYCQDEEMPTEVELNLNDYRALIAAIWAARDQGVRVRIPQIKVVREYSEDAYFAPAVMAERKAQRKLQAQMEEGKTADFDFSETNDSDQGTEAAAEIEEGAAIVQDYGSEEEECQESENSAEE